MPDWKKQIRNYFSFSHTERRGIVILLGIFLMLVLANILLPYVVTHEKSDFSAFKNEIAEFEKNLKLNDSIKNTRATESSRDANNLTPFEFDPNDLPAEKWKEMGLSERQIKIIKNYESKGGRFRKKEDLAKIYGISEAEYHKLEPFITIDKTQFKKKEQINTAPQLNPFIFDPNLITEADLLKMGLRESLIHTIMNYRDKGGHFNKAEDLSKIYGMKPEELAVLEPWVQIAVDSFPSYTKEIPDKKIDIIIELNTADTLDLQQLRGIGPSFARRIVKYRNMLGGYYKKEQLLDVFGMDSTRYLGLLEHITVNGNLVKKININKSTIKELMRHPYIEFYVAKSIVLHKEEIGEYSDITQLKEVKLMYEDLYQKLAPYLTVE